jgi:hypothetical protein
MLEAAAVIARTKGLPLVGCCAPAAPTSPKDFSALARMGQGRTGPHRLLGRRAHHRDGGRRPAGQRPRAPAGHRRPRGDDRGAYAFVSGPTMVAEFTGVVIDNDELGGAVSHSALQRCRHDGGPRPGARSTRPRRCSPTSRRTTTKEPPRWPTDDADRPSTPEAGRLIPASSTGSYDVRVGHPGPRRRRRAAGAASPVGGERGHRAHHHRRHARGRGGQPAAGARRHARHPRLAEGRPLRRHLRRVQPADHHARRHPGLLPGQGPRVAGHDPPRRHSWCSPTAAPPCRASA